MARAKASPEEDVTSLPPSLQVWLCSVVLMAAGFDIQTRRIPNWLTVSGLVGGFILQAGLRRMAGLRDAAFGTALAFCIYFALFALRAMGAGDVKLMSAIGAIVGPSNWLLVFLIAAIAGGILAVLTVATHGTLLKTVSNVRFVLLHLVRGKAPYKGNPIMDVSHSSAQTLPHAVPIAIASLLYLMLAAGHR